MIASSLRSRLLALATVSIIVAQTGVSAPAVRAADPVAPRTAPPAAAPSDPAATANPTPSSTATPSVGSTPIALTLNATTVSESAANAGPASASAASTVTVDAGVQLGVANPTTRLDPRLNVDVIPQWSVHPGSPLTISAQLTYPAASLSVASDVTATNPTSVTSTIESVTITLEKRAAGQGSWIAFASYQAVRPSWVQIDPPPTGLPAIGMTASGKNASGVVYPESFDAFIGATMAPGATADWETSFDVLLDVALVHALQDPGETSGIRQVLHFEVSYASGAFAQPADLALEDTTVIQALGSSVSSASIAIDLAGNALGTFDAATVPALAQFDLGMPAITVEANATVAGTTAKTGGESDAQYIARLRSYGPITAGAHATATNSTSGATGADDTQRIAIEIPILVITAPPLSASTTGGSQVSVSLQILNAGNIPANATSVASSLSGNITGTASGLGSTLGSTRTANMIVTYQVPTSHPEGTSTSTVAVSWADADGNTYGPVASSSDVWVTSGQAGFPSVSLAASSESMFATEPLVAGASDDVAVTAVDLLVNGATSDTISNAPYEFEWDTTALPNGDHVVQMRAHDADGHASTTAPLSVHVDNSLASDVRVSADLAGGRISPDAAATIQVDAIFEPVSMPARYQSDTAQANTGTEALLAAVAQWTTLETETQQAIIDKLAAVDDGWSVRGTPSQVLTSASPDFADRCSLFGPCVLETDHFRMEYNIDQGNPHNPPLDDAWQLSAGNDLQTACGNCDGVPDWVDRLAYGFEQSWQTYNDLGYPMPGSRTRVVVSDFLFELGPFSIHDLDGRGMTIPWETIVPYGGYNIVDPIYVARHEFFHTMQVDLLVPENLDEASKEWALLGTLAADMTHDPRWLLEATAEWGAHTAESRSSLDWEDDTWPTVGSATGDHQRYARILSEMLKQPERALALSDDNREYGAFTFAEFFEEWAADSTTFSGNGALEPTPGVIKDIWTNIGNQQSSVEAIGSALAAMNPSSNFADALSAYTRANYLLDAPGVIGTYRDSDSGRWRDQLGAIWANSLTLGDAQPGAFSDLPRPRRRQLILDDFYGEQSASLEPGGSSYLEFKLPAKGGRYLFLFGAPVGVQVRASITAFSTYPTPCAANMSIDLTGDDWSTMFFADDCQFVTVMLTHVNPLDGIPTAVTVGVQPQLVSDTFERTVLDGWGTADQGWQWKASRPGGVFGGVAGGAGRLTVGSLTGTRIGVDPPVENLLAIGHFSDCGPATDLVLFDAGSPIIVTTSGLLVGSGTSYVQLDNFDPCKPWYIRIEGVNGKVWQATEPEPATSQVVTSPTSWPGHVEIDVIGSPSTPTREFLLDWISIDLEPASRGDKQ